MQTRRGSVIVLAAGLLCHVCAGAEFVDGPDVIGLWHMETAIAYGGGRQQTIDDDSANPGRDHHLVLGASGDLTLPQLVPGGLYGQALSLDGVNDACYVQYWIDGTTNAYIAVDVSFKPAAVGGATQTIVCAGAEQAVPDGFELRIDSDGRLTWAVWGSGGPGLVQTASAISTGVWHTVHADLAADALSLQVDGAAPIVTPYDGYLTCRARPHVGSWQGGAQYFGGLVDELKIEGLPVEPVHPSLLFSTNDLPAIRSKIQSGWLTNAFVKMKAHADTFMGVATTPYVPGGATAGRYLNTRINDLALTGYILDDTNYINKAIAIMCACAEQTDVPFFFAANEEIAVGDAAHAYAIGYDWLYPYMTDGQRASIRSEIEEFGQWLHADAGYYSSLNPTPVSCNHNAVMHGGLGLCALTLGGHANWLGKATDHIRGYFEYARDDDGYNYEGLGYYCYGSLGAIPFSVALLKSGGPDLVDGEFKNRLIPAWILRQVLPWGGGLILMNDSGPDIGSVGGFMHLVAKYQDRVGLWTWLRLMGPVSGGGDGSYGIGKNEMYLGGGSSVPYVILFADQTLQPLSPAEAGLDPSCFFTSTGAHPGGRASFRSGWEDRDALATFTSGFDQHRGHNHRDENSFTFTALGEEFAIDPGYDPWDTRSHNAILVDGIGQMYDPPDYDVCGQVLDHADYGDALYIKGDAQDAYLDSAHVAMATRKLLFVKGPQPYLVVADDIQKDSGTGQFTWLFHTAKTNAIVAGPGAGAVITGGRRGAKCRIRFLWPESGLQVSEKDLTGETFVARNGTNLYSKYFKELQAVTTSTNPFYVAVISAAESADNPPVIASTGSPTNMQITVSFTNGTVDTINLNRETMTFSRAAPLPSVRIADIRLDATHVWIVSNGADTPVPRPLYSTNLTTTNWYPVTNWQSAFSSGIHSQWFDRMTDAPQYFFKLSTDAP